MENFITDRHQSPTCKPSGMTSFCEGINTDKTHVVHSVRGVKFLGVEIFSAYTKIQASKVRGFKAKVKSITRRNSPVNLEKVIEDLTPVVRGFANYFRIADCKGLFGELSKWIRRRLRCKQMALWKKPGRLHRRLRQLGYRGDFSKVRMQSWHNSKSPLASYALPNKHFDDLGLFDLGSVQTGIPVSWK